MELNHRLKNLEEKIFLSKQELSKIKDSDKKDEKLEAEQIEKAMIEMAQGMKQYANNFKTQFQKDQ
jgi:hypothetical protein